jgi:hypothetical protein
MIESAALDQKFVEQSVQALRGPRCPLARQGRFDGRHGALAIFAVARPVCHTAARHRHQIQGIAPQVVE